MQLFEEMQQQRLEPNVNTGTAVTSPGCVTLQLSDEIRQQGLEPNVIAYNAAISAIESAKQPDRRWSCLQRCGRKS